jgi:hypothetical protein
MLRLTLVMLAITIAAVVVSNLLPPGLLADCALIVGACTGVFTAGMLFLLLIQAISPMREEDEAEAPADPPGQRRRAA